MQPELTAIQQKQQTITYQERIELLNFLKNFLVREEDKIIEALQKDLGKSHS